MSLQCQEVRGRDLELPLETLKLSESWGWAGAVGNKFRSTEVRCIQPTANEVVAQLSRPKTCNVYVCVCVCECAQHMQPFVKIFMLAPVRERQAVTAPPPTPLFHEECQYSSHYKPNKTRGTIWRHSKRPAVYSCFLCSILFGAALKAALNWYFNTTI